MCVYSHSFVYYDIDTPFLQARTLELYKLLGILPEVEKRSTKLPPRNIYPQGRDEPIIQAPLVDELPMETQYYRVRMLDFST
jgi:hypothetical protein